MAQEIESGLWLGDFTDAQTFEGEILCVHEHLRAMGPRSKRVPILFPYDKENPVMRCDPAALDRVSGLIQAAQARSEPILIHCFAGAERAPLAVVWHLMRMRGLTVDQAYEQIARERTVLDRRGWLHGAIPVWFNASEPINQGIE